MRLDALCALALLVACAPVACGTDGEAGSHSDLLQMGEVCIPSVETQPLFRGFSYQEVNIDTEHRRCASGVCLVNHFQGRVTCPYGQSEEELDLPPGDPRRCRIPDETYAVTDQPVEVPVVPQIATRSPEDSVYCSCRCAGPDPNASYCACPSGTECVELVADIGLGDRGGFVGSYCIKPGTTFDESSPSPLCDKDGTTSESDCGNDRQNP